MKPSINSKIARAVYGIYPNRLRQVRLKRGLTQADAAQKLGVGSSLLSCWETGAREPRASDVKKLLTLYRLPFETLFPNS